jgi:two-component system NtrC family sensor kinase
MLVWILFFVALALLAGLLLSLRRQRLLVRRLDALEESRHKEEDLRQSEKLAAISRLVAGAAHEINNPLTAIMGYAELLATDSNLSADQRNFADKIRQQARRTKAITASLQSFSSQQPEQRKQLLDLNPIVASALRIQEMNFGLNKISFREDLDPNLPRINGDEYQILEVCMHILNNSVDALKDSGGGAITARTRSEGDMVMLEFTDSGPGIAEPSRIFDPFYTTKPVGNGAGLGLSACYGIIQGHGGSIQISNRPQGGVLAVIKLPAATLADVSTGMAASGLRR